MDHSILGYFFAAGLVVKCVMLILLAASLASWTIIFQRNALLKSSLTAVQRFEKRFWSGLDLNKLYQEIDGRKSAGLEAIFYAGFREYIRLNKQMSVPPESLLDGISRAMRVALQRELMKLEQQLGFLATVGSTSPYIGLLGTVWGIMTSFQALGSAQQASIALVAPGISEALVATAMGLFAAIPAVIAYNRLNTRVTQLTDRYQVFQEEFVNLLYRQLQMAFNKSNRNQLEVA